jgi:hypothetical protein
LAPPRQRDPAATLGRATLLIIDIGHSHTSSWHG